MRKKAELNVEVPNSILAQLNGAIPGDGFEYIARCSINENNELLLHTNYGRTLNAGEIPVGELTENHYEKIIERVGEAEALNPVFVAELRFEDGKYVSNKTFEELKPHIAALDVVVCDFFDTDSNGDFRRTRAWLSVTTDASATFVMRSADGVEESFTFTADGVTHSVSEDAASVLYAVAFTETDGTYTADKTFAEVKAALDDGNVVVGDWVMTSGTQRGQLTGVSNEILEFTFHGYWCADEYLLMKYDNSVDHIVSEVGKGKMPSLVAVVKTDTQLTVTATYGWKDEITTIALNDDGDPVSVTKDGKTTTLTWSGFDE